MRLCRIGPEATPAVALYFDDGVVPLREAAAAFVRAGNRLALPDSVDLLDFLPPDGVGHAAAAEVARWAADHAPRRQADLLVPVPRPSKIFLLAGNYADHVREGGGVAAEREQTFPYVFMKPPTTLTAPGAPVRLPAAAPDHVDWELELGVVIGRKAKSVSEAEALSYVAGYVVVNDVSQRRYRPNPGRKPREKDGFFDWLHGKWFDSFCPCGPCVATPAAVPDPQRLRMTLTLNGQVRQDGGTSQMIFPVAAIVAFVSRMVTLEPGDLISTGTPAGVGSSTGTFLKPGDVLRGRIEGVGELVTPVVAE